MNFANSAGKLQKSSSFSRLAAEQRKRPSEQAGEPEEQSEDDKENREGRMTWHR